MRDKQREKGIILLMVSGLSLVIFVGIMGLLFVLGAHTRKAEAFKERAKAYYLCEVGASVAILDIANAKIGTGPGRWTQRRFDYKIEDKTYQINYQVTKSRGRWQIVSWVDSSSGFNRTYKLRVGGQRAFPIFIWGFAGK